MCCFATSPAGCSSTPTCAPSPMRPRSHRGLQLWRHPARRPRRQLVGKHGLAGIEVVATDPAESFRAGLSPHLDHARRVADPFHVVRVADRCVDQVRRRIQNQRWDITAASMAALPDPRAAPHRQPTPRPAWLGWDAVGLRIGDPHDELLGAWLAKESVRDVYLADTPADAATVLDKAIVGCAAADVAEIRSLGNTLKPWRTEILAHHDCGASNGPTEGLNLCVKKVKRCKHGFRSFENYRFASCFTPAASQAQTTPATAHPNRLSPLRRVEPPIRCPEPHDADRLPTTCHPYLADRIRRAWPPRGARRRRRRRSWRPSNGCATSDSHRDRDRGQDREAAGCCSLGGDAAAGQRAHQCRGGEAVGTLEGCGYGDAVTQQRWARPQGERQEAGDDKGDPRASLPCLLCRAGCFDGARRSPCP